MLELSDEILKEYIHIHYDVYLKTKAAVDIYYSIKGKQYPYNIEYYGVYITETGMGVEVVTEDEHRHSIDHIFFPVTILQVEDPTELVQKVIAEENINY